MLLLQILTDRFLGETESPSTTNSQNDMNDNYPREGQEMRLEVWASESELES